MEINQNFIDVEKVIGSKNPRLLRFLPGFVIRYLKRILHQDPINERLYKYRDKIGLDFVEAILNDFGAIIEVTDKAHHLTNSPSHQLSDLIPADRRLLIVSNHPLGGLDGMVLMNVIGKVRPEIVFPVNDFLMFLPPLQPLFIPINKHGRNAENLALFDQTFASDKAILYFPAGLVSRKQKGGEIKDLEWKKTFITKTRKFQRDVLPVYISGKNSNFFYNLARFRRKLGIGRISRCFILLMRCFVKKTRSSVSPLATSSPTPPSTNQKQIPSGPHG